MGQGEGTAQQSNMSTPQLCALWQPLASSGEEISDHCTSKARHPNDRAHRGNEDVQRSRHSVGMQSHTQSTEEDTSVRERAPDQLAGQVQERLLVIVVGLGADFVVLQVLLAVEGHLLRLHLQGRACQMSVQRHNFQAVR